MLKETGSPTPDRLPKIFKILSEAISDPDDSFSSLKFKQKVQQFLLGYREQTIGKAGEGKRVEWSFNGPLKVDEAELFAELGVKFDEEDDPEKVIWFRHNIRQIAFGLQKLGIGELNMKNFQAMKFKDNANQEGKKQWVEWLDLMVTLLEPYPFFDYRTENSVIKFLFQGFGQTTFTDFDDVPKTYQQYFMDKIFVKLDEPTKQRVIKLLGPEGLGFIPNIG